MTSKDLDTKLDVNDTNSISQSDVNQNVANDQESSLQNGTLDSVKNAEQVAASTPDHSSVKILGKESSAQLFEAALAELEDPEYNRSDNTYTPFTKGERVEATVIQLDKERVFVDLGMKSEGILPLNELTDENVDSPADLVSVGDKIDVIVIKPGNGEKSTIVSKKRADFENAWHQVVKANATGETIEAPVVDRVKGGLIADVGVKGFVPTSHVGSGNLRNVDKYVGQLLKFKVIEVDKERKKVVLSNKLAEEENRKEAQSKAFSTLSVNDIIPGTVRRLTEYGAFVDIGGVDGLLHISEMSWARISHPKEVLKEGQDIQVMVLKLDQSIGKISLGLRQVLPDPWNLVKEHYRVGDKVKAKVNRLSVSGAFLRLEEGAEAFLPISEISEEKVAKLEEAISVGQDLELVIVDLQVSARRMLLSLKQLNSESSPVRNADALEDYEDSMPRGAAKKKKRRKTSREEDYDRGAGNKLNNNSGGATIGERLGKLQGLFSQISDSKEKN